MDALVFGAETDNMDTLGKAARAVAGTDDRLSAYIKEEMKKIIDYGLRDTLQGRVIDGTGKNSSWTTDDNIPFRSQSALYDCYLEKNQE